MISAKHFLYRFTFTETNEYLFGVHAGLDISELYQNYSDAIKTRIAAGENFTVKIIRIFANAKDAHAEFEKQVGIVALSDGKCLNKQVFTRKVETKKVRTKWPIHSREYLLKLAKQGNAARRGQRLPREVVLKRNAAIKLGMVGVDAGAGSRRKYEVNGKIYYGTEAITKDLGVCRTLIWRRLNSTDPLWKDWRYVN